MVWALCVQYIPRGKNLALKRACLGPNHSPGLVHDSGLIPHFRNLEMINVPISAGSREHEMSYHVGKAWDSDWHVYLVYMPRFLAATLPWVPEDSL